jgi:hypothetical protein
MKKTLLALAALSSIAAHADSGVDFTFKMRGGYFTLDINQLYPPNVSLDQIRSAYDDLSLTPEVSNLVKQMNRYPTDDGFRLETSATKFMISMTTVNLCTESSSDSDWNQSCHLDPSSSTNRLLFQNASAASSSSCTQSGGGQATCHFHFEGQPKAMHYIVLNRSAQQVAAAGAAESIHDLSSIFLYISTHQTPKGAKAAFESSTLGGMGDRMYNDVTNLTGQMGGGQIVVTGSGRTGAYSAGVQ